MLRSFSPELFAGHHVVFKMSRVGSGRVRKCVQKLTGRVGSGQEVFKSRGSGQPRSGQEFFKSHGSGRVGSRGR